VLAGGFWRHLSESATPLAFNYLGIERLATVFGDTELPLRLPSILAIPVLGAATYRLGRHLLAPWIAALVAALVLLNSSLLIYGLQMKPFIIEAAAAVLAVNCWLYAQRAPSVGRMLLAYLGVAFLTLFGLAVVFPVAGLLLDDAARVVVRRWRDGRTGARLIGMATVGITALLHIGLFLLPQSPRIAKSDYWAKSYLPPGLSGAHFVWRSLRDFPALLSSSGYLSPDLTDPSFRNSALIRHVSPLDTVVAVGVAAALLAGAVGVLLRLRAPAARALLSTIGTSLVLSLVAAGIHEWPFGPTRVNLFLLPLLALLAAYGAVTAVGWARRLPAAGLLACLLIVPIIGIVPLQAARLNQLHREQKMPMLMDRIKQVVADVRSSAGDQDVVVLTEPFPVPQAYFKGWYYYTSRYDWPASQAQRPTVPDSRTLTIRGLSPAAVRELVAQHPGARRIFIFELRNYGRERYPAVLQGLRAQGFCDVQRRDYVVTGALFTLTRGPCQ
jgi:hypothetical protein